MPKTNKMLQRRRFKLPVIEQSMPTTPELDSATATLRVASTTIQNIFYPNHNELGYAHELSLSACVPCQKRPHRFANLVVVIWIEGAVPTSHFGSEMTSHFDTQDLHLTSHFEQLLIPTDFPLSSWL